MRLISSESVPCSFKKMPYHTKMSEKLAYQCQLYYSVVAMVTDNLENSELLELKGFLETISLKNPDFLEVVQSTSMSHLLRLPIH